SGAETGGAVLLANGKVLVVGGDPGNGPYSAEVYDPSTGIFTATGNPAALLDTFAATLLPDGKVLIAGGTGRMSFTFDGVRRGEAPFCCFNSAELYDPSTGVFFPNVNSMVSGRAG